MFHLNYELSKQSSMSSMTLPKFFCYTAADSVCLKSKINISAVKLMNVILIQNIIEALIEVIQVE